MRLGAIFLTATLLTSCATSGAAESISDVYRRVHPAVVVIRTRGRDVASRPSSQRGGRFVSVSGLGSGVYVKKKDKHYILTAAHVVQTADDLYVEFQAGKKINATIKASIPTTDVALLELDHAPEDVRPLRIGDSDKVQVGDRVMVVGAPLGLSRTLTVGYISARRRSSQVMAGLEAVELFQTDAAINTGNSGGPLFNERGEVIGIVSHILSRSGGFEGMGFAVTSNLTSQLLFAEGSYWSGIESIMLTGELAQVFNLPQPTGLLVQRIARRSPGEKLGLRAGTLEATIAGVELIVGGDIVLEINGITIDENVENAKKIQISMRAMKDTDVLKVKVLRAGKIHDITGFLFRS